MSDKTDEWVTVAAAARITDRPDNSIFNWYKTDKTVRFKRIGTRRVLVNLADCIEHDKHRSRRKRKTKPVVVVAPAVVVDLVPFSLAGQQCQGWRIDGEELLDAGLLGRLLDYAGKGLVNTIAGAWSDEFIDGEHFRIIDGPALEALKRQVVENNSTTSAPKYAPSIMTLTRAGVALVLLKTCKPIGVALRRALAGAHFMAELLDGNPEPMRQAVTKQGDFSMVMAAVLESNRAVLQTMESIGRMISTMAEGTHRPARRDDPDARCIHSARAIARKLRAEYPYAGLISETQVHELARRLKLRGADRQGLIGMSMHVPRPAGFPVIMYSTHALDRMRDELHRQAILFDG
jgi:hypothetical protein